jgi:hypothetical protein
MDHNLSRLSCALTILGLALLRPPLTYGQVSVLTYHNDNARSGQNTNETILAPSNVNSSQFAKVFSHSVDGFIVGQPLYLQNVSVPGSGSHNVIYVATLHDSVYAFDADNNTGGNSEPLWTVSFINPSVGVTSVPITDAGCGGVTQFTEQGVIGTPVIDPNSGTLYLIAKTKENGNYVQRLHALDVGSGKETPRGPVTIAAEVTGNGDGGATVSFDPLRNMSRTGLLLDNGVLYATFGSNGCKDITNRGWVIAYRAFLLQSLGAFSTEPNSTNAAIWQSGSGAAADASGNVFFETGDGLFDGNTGGPDFGDSILKMSLSGGGPSVTDYFTPFNQAVFNQNDLDLGSVGPLLLPDQPGNHPHLLVGSGKDQTIYLVDRDNMGHFNPVDNSQIVQTVAAFSSHERWGAPAYWNGLLYFVQAIDGVIAYSLSGGLLSNQPVSRTPRGYQLTATPSVSASGTNNGILWFISRTDRRSLGTLHAFDATNLSTELYNSDQAGVRDTLGPVAHFGVPTIASGKVYVGTQSELVVYGLTGPAAALSPLTLTFAKQPVGTTSAPQTITLTNAGAAPLTISSIAVGPNFTQTDSCGASVPAGAKCTISVVFAPTSSGNLTGTLTIADNASGSPQTVPLSGTGADFSLSAASGSSTSQTVAPGQSATYTLNLSPAGGFNQAVSLSCSGTPAQSTCSVSPSTITPGGTAPVPVTVTVSTTAPSAATPGVNRTPPPLKRLPQVLWFLGVASLLGFLTGSRWLAGAGRDAPKHQPSGPSVPVGVVTILVLLWSSCGGGAMGPSSNTSNPGTPAGTYTLTVTGVSTSGSASLTRDLKLSLTVQ